MIHIYIYICIYIYVCVYVCMWIYDDIHMMIYDILYRWRFVTEVNLHPLTWIQPVQWAGARGVSSIAGSDSRSVTALPHNRVGEGGIDGYVGRWSAVICWSYRFFFLWPLFKGQLNTFHMGMDQYLLIPCLGGWTSIYQLFWCELQGYYWFWHTAIWIVIIKYGIFLWKMGDFPAKQLTLMTGGLVGTDVEICWPY